MWLLTTSERGNTFYTLKEIPAYLIQFLLTDDNFPNKGCVTGESCYHTVIVGVGLSNCDTYILPFSYDALGDIAFV